MNLTKAKNRAKTFVTILLSMTIVSALVQTLNGMDVGTLWTLIFAWTLHALRKRL